MANPIAKFIAKFKGKKKKDEDVKITQPTSKEKTEIWDRMIKKYPDIYEMGYSGIRPKKGRGGYG